MIEVVVLGLGWIRRSQSYVVVLQEKGGDASAAHLDRPGRGRIDRACTCTT